MALDYMPVLPEIIVLAGACIILLVDVWMDDQRRRLFTKRSQEYELACWQIGVQADPIPHLIVQVARLRRHHPRSGKRTREVAQLIEFVQIPQCIPVFGDVEAHRTAKVLSARIELIRVGLDTLRAAT